MESILKNKKAHGLDTILAVATIFGLAIFCLVITYTYSQVVLTVRNNTIFNETEQAIDAMVVIEEVNNNWDYIILAIFIGFAMAMAILGYFIDVNTIFFPFFIIVMLIGVIISSVLSYVWDNIADTSIFTAVKATSFPITTHLMNNLIIYYIIIAAIALVATYAKTGGGE